MVTSDDKWFWVRGLSVGDEIQPIADRDGWRRLILARCGRLVAVSQPFSRREGQPSYPGLDHFGTWMTEQTIYEGYEKPPKKEA